MRFSVSAGLQIGYSQRVRSLILWLLAFVFITVARSSGVPDAERNSVPDAEKTAPYRFQNVAIGAGGFITGFAAHPAERGLYYVRTDIGGAYRWNAAVKQWVPLQDWLPFRERNLLGVESLALDPTDPTKLYLAAGTYVNARTPNGALLRSSDRGHHFEITRLPFKLGSNEDGRFAGERLQVDPNQPQTLLLGTREAGLWRSGNAGANWGRVQSFPALPLNDDGLTFVAFDPSSGPKGQPTPVIFVGVNDPIANLLRSDDAGRSWKPVLGGPDGMFPNHGVFAADGTMYLSYSDTPGPNGMTHGAVWAYVPRTGQWRDVTPQSAQGFGYGTFAVDPEHAGTLLASTMDRWHPGDTIFRSADAGAHWTSLKENAVRDASPAPYLKHTAANTEPPFGHWIGAVMIDPFDSAHVLYGTGETIWESHDAESQTTHWEAGAPGIEETANITLLSPALSGDAEPHLYTGMADIGCFRHDDLTRSPPGGAMKPEFSDCDAIALAAGKPGEMVRVGRSWTSGPPGPHGAVSHDDGKSWTPFASEPPHAEQGGDAAISADGRLLLWAIRGGPLAISADNGAHWRVLSPQGLGDTSSGQSVQVLADTRKLQSFWVYRPETGELDTVGTSGVAMPVSKTGPKNGNLRIAAVRPDVLWIASGTGLFRWKTDTGSEPWVPVGSVAAAYAVGFGKAARAQTAPAIYLAGALAGTPDAAAAQTSQSRGGGLYRSLDDGTTWERIDDREHRYAWVEQITGDPRVFGRVYFGTNGRGVFWGEPAP